MGIYVLKLKFGNYDDIPVTIWVSINHLTITLTLWPFDSFTSCFSIKHHLYIWYSKTIWPKRIKISSNQYGQKNRTSSLV